MCAHHKKIIILIIIIEEGAVSRREEGAIRVWEETFGGDSFCGIDYRDGFMLFTCFQADQIMYINYIQLCL